MQTKIVGVFVGFFLIYYFFSFPDYEATQLLLTISTFAFTIFMGFFISRQGIRYSRIVSLITSFDGNISSIYRELGHLGVAAQEKSKSIIDKHYRVILEKNAWDYNFTHKSTTIADFHKLLDELKMDKGKNPPLKNFPFMRILTSLDQMQVIRKEMIALHGQRVPSFQWYMLSFLTFIVIVALTIIPSQGVLLYAFLKATFATAILMILLLLFQFDRLKFFEKTIGESSARDILDILADRR